MCKIFLLKIEMKTEKGNMQSIEIEVIVIFVWEIKR